MCPSLNHAGNPGRLSGASLELVVMQGTFATLSEMAYVDHPDGHQTAMTTTQVRSLINGQRQMGGKTLMPGGSSLELHSEQIKAGQNTGFSTMAPSEPPTKPRTSEGAISIEARTGVSLDVKALLVPGHRPDFSQDRLLESAGMPHVTNVAESAEAEDRGQSSSPGMVFLTCPAFLALNHSAACFNMNSVLPRALVLLLFRGPKYKEALRSECHAAGESYNSSARNEHKIVKTQFYGRSSGIGQLAPQEPIRIDIWAMLRLLLYIASFGFYLFTRSTTMNARGSVPLFLYQLAVIIFEGFHFFSGCLVGLWQVSSLTYR